MIISKILFSVKKNEIGKLERTLETNVAPFKEIRGFKEILIYKNEKAEVTSLTVYEDQESANQAISKLYLLFQSIESKLKNLPLRVFISLKEFENFSDGRLVFHYKI